MKLIILISLILLLVPMQAANPGIEFASDRQITENMNNTDESIRDSSIDSDIFNSDPDILAIKPQQRSLPRLSNKDKVKWSFKMAKKNIFL